VGWGIRSWADALVEVRDAVGMRWGCGGCGGFDVANERSGWVCLDVGDGDQIKLVRQMSYISNLDAGLLIKISDY
jgi:hypothetical protein